MSTTVQIRKKGQMTIPANIREQLGIEENDVVTVSLLGEKAVIIVPQKLKTTQLIEEISDMAKRKGVTLEEMLVELDQIRHSS